MKDQDTQTHATAGLFGEVPGLPQMFTDPEQIARIRREKMEDDERLRAQVLDYNERQHQQQLKQQQEVNQLQLKQQQDAHSQTMTQQREIWDLRNSQIERLVNLASTKGCAITIHANGTVEIAPRRDPDTEQRDMSLLHALFNGMKAAAESFSK